MKKCEACREGRSLPFALQTAFQPIVDLQTGAVFAYEALVRGENGCGAADVLSRVTDENLYAFDQACRVQAIRSAVQAGIVETGAMLSINFMPNAVYSPEACIRLTLQTARQTGMPSDRLIFEFTENERLDSAHVATIVDAYRQLGFKTAIDDFGAGFSGLNLLALFNTDIVKLDMELVRGIDQCAVRPHIVQSMVSLCNMLGRDLVIEGIETADELRTVAHLGVRYAQGYYLAKPQIGELPAYDLGLVRRLAA